MAHYKIVEISTMPVSEGKRIAGDTFFREVAGSNMPETADYVKDSPDREEDIRQFMAELPDGMFEREGDRLTYRCVPENWLEGYAGRIREEAASLDRTNVLDFMKRSSLHNAICPYTETNIYRDGCCEGLTEWLLDFIAGHAVGDSIHLGGTADFHC